MQSRKETRKEDSIAAQGDDGKRYTIDLFREYVTTIMLDGSADITPGLWAFKLNGGGAVNRIDSDNYQVVATGVRLRKL